MKIAILGTIVYDEIVTHRGERKCSFGGITYNVAALASLIDEDVQLVPIAQVGYDRYDEVRELFAGYRGVVSDGLRRMPNRKNPHVQLVFTSVTERTEHMEHIPPPLTPEQVELATECDAILVNFITGRELDLPAFSTLGSRAKGLLHVDVHNKITEWTPEGEREFVGLQDWKVWFSYATTVQMNEFEVEHLLHRPIRGSTEYVQAAAEILAAGPQAVIITLGPQGSAMAYRRSDGVYGCLWPAANLGEVIDTTGCGDSFSAGFVWFYLQHGDMMWANAAANVVGDINCITPGIGNLDRARQMDELIPLAFGERAKLLKEGWPGEKLS